MFQNVARIFDSALGSKEKEKFLGAFVGVDPMFVMTIDFYLGDLGAGSGRVSDAGNATHPFCKRGRQPTR